MNTSKFSIILLNYNTYYYTEQCIRSILETNYTNFEIIVVDNDSNDKSKIGDLENIDDRVKVIASEKNLGFGGGNNLGVRYAKSDYIIILNNDTIIYHDTIEKINNHLHNLEEKTIITGVIEGPDGNVQMSGGKDPNLINEILEFGFFLIKHGPKKYYRNYYFYPNENSEPRLLDWTTGCFFVISKGFYELLNGFDENMFMYIEDVELSKRAREMGGKIQFYPDVKIKHFGSQSAKNYKEVVLRSEFQNTIYYFRKHSSKLNIFLFLMISKSIFFVWYIIFSTLLIFPNKYKSKFLEKKSIFNTLLRA